MFKTVILQLYICHCLLWVESAKNPPVLLKNDAGDFSFDFLHTNLEIDYFE